MVNIALVEDDKSYLENLISNLKMFERDSGEKFQISTFEDGEDIVTGYKTDFDIILMDVEMNFMDGLTAAEEIRKIDKEVVIIFITNMPQYAIKGYTVEALDYVLKPVSYFAFSQRIERALERMKRRKKKYHTIINNGVMKKIDVSKICYIEVRDHELVFHTTEGNYITRGTIRDTEKNFDREMFFRCNRCYLVNLEYVESFENNIATIFKDEIQVSRARKKEFLDRLNNYINEVSK